MFRLLDMNFQSSKFKLKKILNSWENEPYFILHAPQVMCHMLYLTSTFGGGPQSSCLVDAWTPLSTQLGNISEISTPGLNLVGKYSSKLWASKQPHQVTKPLYMPEIMDYHNTLADSTLNILFLERLKFSKIFFSTKSNFFLLRKVKDLLKHFIFNMESSKLINYSKDIHWSCPNIIAIACTTFMYKTGSCPQKTTRMQSSWAFFWSSSVRPTLWQTCEKWWDLQLYFHQILWGHLLLNIFYFTFGKKQTQHFIVRK